MWTIKYRPNKLDNIIGNEVIIKSIKSMMPEIPHMLFKGPPGVGKTTTALAIVNELGCVYKEINASDESGIDVVRTTIKNFVNTGGLDGKFKVLILDEADETTSDFQTALRRLMEKYGQNCRFILTCNNPQNIIEAIQSRCRGGIFDFQPIQFDEFKRAILSILSKELMTITDDALLKLHELSNGDMRVIDKLYNISFQTKNITLKDVIEIKDDDSWKELLKLIRENKYKEACKFSNKSHIIPMFNSLFDSETDEEKLKKITKIIAEWEFRKHFVQTEYIQLYALISYLISILKIEQTKTSSVSSPSKVNIFGTH